MAMLKKNKGKCQASRGFTMLELLITIAILGILVGLAAPNYRSMIDRQKVRSVLNEWKSSFYFAQSEALRLKDGVIFCASDADGKRCSGSSDFSNGWLVLHEVAGQDPEILQDSPLTDNRVRIILDGGTLGQLRFLGNGRPSNLNAGGSITVKLKNHELKVNISSGGRLRGA
ncbi:prepilin-type cleavage/methylation protein [Cardiobacterium valvarum F0432]|uniref:Type II secretion system protein H n=2 Tax=Cardiobacterium valvarum TaxID=194702 RepID=G9ZI45_9GAMM|nr:prepilin-type cleavage/methylation protein [Cardiobacterium valvarum F0432]